MSSKSKQKRENFHFKIENKLNNFNAFWYCFSKLRLTLIASHHVVATHCCAGERSKCIVALGRWYHQRPIVIVLYCRCWLWLTSLLCQVPLNRLKIRSMLRFFGEYSKHALVLVVVERFDRFPFSCSKRNKKYQSEKSKEISISVKVLIQMNEWELGKSIVHGLHGQLT